MSEILVLSVGVDPSILYAREAALRSAGYIVVSALAVHEAFRLFQDGDFDLAVLCHTLPTMDRERLTSLIRASGSCIPVASVSETAAEQTVQSDVILEQNAVELVAGIRRLLGRPFEAVSRGASPACRTERVTLTLRTSQASSSGNRFQKCGARRLFGSHNFRWHAKA